MTNKKLEKILVVEDDSKHLADAEKFFDGIKGIHVNYATTFSEAEEFLGRYENEEPEVDGVITDIYFSLGGKYVGRTRDEDPIGLLVAAKCHMKNLPFVFCTAGYHHGEKYNWINMLQRTMKWPEMVDVRWKDRHVEAEHKQWDKAYEILKTLVENPSK